MHPRSISELERETGVGRTTIHYYIRAGLLPPAQKASPTHSVYSGTHVELLAEIQRLKREGLTLREIEEKIRPALEAATENRVDLVARQNEQMYNAILEAAAHRFAELGYERTRISDICRDLGATPPVVYSHFPSKRHLFIACFQTFFRWSNVGLAERVRDTNDSAINQAWFSRANYARQAFSSDLESLARVEALHPESELRPLVRQTYEEMLADPIRELKKEHSPDANPGLFDDELIAYGLLGALESMQMRASWDDKYSEMDVIRNRVAMFLAIRAAYTGRVDLAKEWRAIADTVEKIAAEIRQVRQGE
jgi:AcrR family transcriptional regulator